MIVDISIFTPSSRDIRLEYPELSIVEEFKLLSDTQLKFVWWFACPTSPLADTTSPVFERDPKKRVALALLKAGMNLTPEDSQKFTNLNMPDRIRIAIQKMQSYMPTIRAHGKTMQETIFKNYQKIINTDLPVTADAAAKAAYVDIASKISKEIPRLVVEIEDAYGIRINKYEQDKKEGSVKLIDKIMDSQE